MDEKLYPKSKIIIKFIIVGHIFLTKFNNRKIFIVALKKNLQFFFLHFISEQHLVAMEFSPDVSTSPHSTCYQRLD